MCTGKEYIMDPKFEYKVTYTRYTPLAGYPQETIDDLQLIQLYDNSVVSAVVCGDEVRIVRVKADGRSCTYLIDMQPLHVLLTNTINNGSDKAWIADDKKYLEFRKLDCGIEISYGGNLSTILPTDYWKKIMCKYVDPVAQACR